ncbi:hypothetical protein CDLVIII_1876 [Clostridium sp. DL-VIII]|uniref:hypothetical protein n=1 Tax=Clostridium sp. DL-VIII TaxID=641107 RepID=UPI00023B001C|nr:hypothetical protein [Clostridium sp. DL-VIII]EHI98562.1 hypothetical protein CDLVIII_1876 [Clostridium sp. DL-VIII]
MNKIDIDKGEKIILWSQGSLWVRDSWRQGYFFLTSRRIVFNNVAKKTLEIKLNNIIKLGIEKRVWILGIRIRQLCIDFEDEQGNKRAFIALGKPKTWSSAIKDSMTLSIAERGIFNGTDSESADNTY